VGFYLDGESLDSKMVSLDPWEEATAEFTFTADEPGIHVVQVGDMSSTFFVESVPPAPAEFIMENLAISPENVTPGEPVTVSVDVANVGGSAGENAVELRVDDELVGTETVTLGPRESTTVSFTVSENEPGTYAVSVGNLVGGFTVQLAAPQPTEFPLIPVIAGVIATVVAILILIAYKRRR